MKNAITNRIVSWYFSSTQMNYIGYGRFRKYSNTAQYGKRIHRMRHLRDIERELHFFTFPPGHGPDDNNMGRPFLICIKEYYTHISDIWIMTFDYFPNLQWPNDTNHNWCFMFVSQSQHRVRDDMGRHCIPIVKGFHGF